MNLNQIKRMRIEQPIAKSQIIKDHDGLVIHSSKEVSDKQWPMWLAWHCFDSEIEYFNEALYSAHNAVDLMKEIGGFTSPQRCIDRINYHMHHGKIRHCVGSVKQYIDDILQDAYIEFNRSKLPDKHDYSLDRRQRVIWDIDTDNWSGDEQSTELQYSKFVHVDYSRTKPAVLKAGAVSLTHYQDIEDSKHLNKSYMKFNPDTGKREVVDMDVQLPYSLRYCELDPSYLAHHQHETQYSSVSTVEEWNAWLMGTRVDLYDKLCSGSELSPEEIQAYCDNDYDIEGHMTVPIMDVDRPMQPELDAYVLADEF